MLPSSASSSSYYIINFVIIINFFFFLFNYMFYSQTMARWATLVALVVLVAAVHGAPSCQGKCDIEGHMTQDGVTCACDLFCDFFEDC